MHLQTPTPPTIHPPRFRIRNSNINRPSRDPLIRNTQAHLTRAIARFASRALGRELWVRVGDEVVV